MKLCEQINRYHIGAGLILLLLLVCACKSSTVYEYLSGTGSVTNSLTYSHSNTSTMDKTAMDNLKKQFELSGSYVVEGQSLTTPSVVDNMLNVGHGLRNGNYGLVLIGGKLVLFNTTDKTLQTATSSHVYGDIHKANRATSLGVSGGNLVLKYNDGSQYNIMRNVQSLRLQSHNIKERQTIGQVTVVLSNGNHRTLITLK